MPPQPSSRPASGSPPSAHRPCPLAPVACESRCRPPTPTPTLTGFSMRCLRFLSFLGRPRRPRRSLFAHLLVESHHLLGFRLLSACIRRRSLTAVARPRRVVAVVGTGTDIGKTWVSAHLLTGLRAADLSVSARKPAQSFDPDDDPAWFRCGDPGRRHRGGTRHRVRAASLVRESLGAADGGGGSGPALVHHRQSGGRVGLAGRGHRSGGNGGRVAITAGGGR